jgi:hypothetical protein
MQEMREQLAFMNVIIDQLQNRLAIRRHGTLRQRGGPTRAWPVLGWARG